MQPRLNAHSTRAQKARVATLFDKSYVRPTIKFLSITLVALAIVLYILKIPFYGPCAAGALIFWMLLMWHKGDLDRLAEISPNKQIKSVDDILDPDILANLKSNNPSAYEIWQAARNAKLYLFFQNRYQLHPEIFEFLDHNPGSGEQVWRNCEELRTTHNLQSYSLGVVVYALIKTIPNIDQALRSMQLELKEIATGIDWLQDAEDKIKRIKQKRFFGGIARDWAYGYTPLLRYLGHNVSEEIQAYGFFRDTSAHAQIVQRMVQSFLSGNNAIALIGELGVGKTTCVYSFTEYLLQNPHIDRRLRYNQVIDLSASAILSEARGPGELESLVARILAEARKAKNIILFFDDAQVFFSQGTGAVDLTNLLQPAIDSGAVRIIFAMKPSDWQNLTARGSAILSKLQPINVQPADEATTIHVLQDHVLELEFKRKIVFTYQSLKEAYRLGKRYIDTQAMPGAALQILEQAKTHIEEGLVTPDGIRQTIEASMGVKLQSAQADESKKLLNLEDELHKHVVNQKQAVSVIANSLRRSRSGVGNPERPIGTFLFLGPTGVGKTELSKALARVYFHDESAMIRVDMNQFVRVEDLDRLITPMHGDQMGFLGQVKKSPFSVILLDEIEKAHPQVVNALLQMLDEGVMRDNQNRQVSFKDAIVIATSNAGADEIRRRIDAGEQLDQKESEFVEYLINNGSFAPEFVNRFDEVVLFRPLTQDELVQVVDLIVAGINKTLDDKKVRVALTENAKRWLVEKGYDSRLGARPMRRMAQRYVENIVAKKLLEGSLAPGSEISLDSSDFEQSNPE